MTIIYLTEDGPSLRDAIRLLMALAGPDREREIEHGTAPLRIQVPDDICTKYLHVENEKRIEAAKTGRREEKVSAPSAPDTRSIPATGVTARKATERRTGR